VSYCAWDSSLQFDRLNREPKRWVSFVVDVPASAALWCGARRFFRRMSVRGYCDRLADGGKGPVPAAPTVGRVAPSACTVMDTGAGYSTGTKLN
jgi:hypothetical protein